ncbi:TolC family protein [Chryseobacterium gleum]|uniref:TolC family protein n=1 Tax=Chryseobacterium gleum TaxID=250 RepID=UPI00289D2A81|nr:TolC family protein [Chryseobacterium gleum]
MIKQKKNILILFLIVLHEGISAQSLNRLNLSESYELARTNYPAIKKLDLLTQSAEFDIQNANKRYLPQVSFSGQATYQSQTVSFGDALSSMPAGIQLPSISKDQYKIQGDVSQLLYDGGNIKNQKELIKANNALQIQNVEANLYAIKQRINTLYFSILLIDAQLKQNEINKSSLQTQVQKTEAALKYGVAYRSNLDELKAEVVNIDMASTEYRSNRTAYLKMLSLFIGKELPETVQLDQPDGELLSPEINRPELKTFDLQKTIYDTQEKQLKSEYLPTVSAFFQGAYGRPTLNIIENKFGPWYVTGIRFSWNLGSLYTLSNRKSILNLNRQTAEADKETFLLNTKIDLTQQDEQIRKYTELLVQDEQVIALRSAVKKSAEAQLDNGVITIHEYIQKVNAENLTIQTKILHEIQLLQAKYNHEFITGN